MISVTNNQVLRYACVLFQIKARLQSALTFVELFLVIIIIGILIGISLPGFRKTFHSRQLNSFSQRLQSYMNYLHDHSIVERKIIYLNIDTKNKKYWAQIKDAPARLKTYTIPKGIEIEVMRLNTDNKQILFLPDGQIDKVTIEITNPDNQKISLTTEAVFGKVKVKSKK